MAAKRLVHTENGVADAFLTQAVRGAPSGHPGSEHGNEFHDRSLGIAKENRTLPPGGPAPAESTLAPNLRERLACLSDAVEVDFRRERVLERQPALLDVSRAHVGHAEVIEP